LKILYFDGSGLWVFAKRLEKGTFAWPAADADACVAMRASELALLLGGLDLTQTRKRRWYERTPA
jgi:transposase